MAWYIYVIRFFAGAFLANGIPHFVNGISGREFPTPFASPPGIGLSPPWVNMIWGLSNLVVGIVLLWVFAGYRFGVNAETLLVAGGFAVMGVVLALRFGRVRKP